MDTKLVDAGAVRTVEQVWLQGGRAANQREFPLEAKATNA